MTPEKRRLGRALWAGTASSQPYRTVHVLSLKFEVQVLYIRNRLCAQSQHSRWSLKHKQAGGVWPCPNPEHQSINSNEGDAIMPGGGTKTPTWERVTMTIQVDLLKYPAELPWMYTYCLDKSRAQRLMLIITVTIAVCAVPGPDIFDLGNARDDQSITR